MLECVVIKTFQAWDETKHTYVTATMKECSNVNIIEPKGTTYTYDSENRVIWIVRRPES